jgi:hypothetical protein
LVLDLTALLIETERDELGLLTARYRLFTIIVGRLPAAEVAHPDPGAASGRLLRPGLGLVAGGGGACLAVSPEAPDPHRSVEPATSGLRVRPLPWDHGQGRGAAVGNPDRIDSLIEARIKAARENGEFDDLPGAGKPIPGQGEPYDEKWWINEFMRREGLSGEVMLPPSMQLATEVERLPGQIHKLPSEQRVRETVSELNARITDYQLRPTNPFVSIKRIDADEMAKAWRDAMAERFPDAEGTGTAAAAEDGTTATRRPIWVRRRSLD